MDSTWESVPSGGPLVRRLPEFYRENLNLLGPLPQIAEEMLLEYGLHQRDEYRRWDARAASTAASRWLPPRISAGPHQVPASAGNLWSTPQTVRCWLRELGVTAAEFWTGFVVLDSGRDAGDGRDVSLLVLRRSQSAGAVVLALSAEELQRPDDLRPPRPEQLPVGVRVQALLGSREALARAPWSGREVRGRLLWNVSASSR